MAEGDRIRGALARFMRTVFSRIDYLGLYPAKVIAQNGQALDLVPDDPRFPALDAVPINLGLPGVEVEVVPGARVLLGFAGGDPAKPRATLWESGSVTELRITATSEITIKATGTVNVEALTVNVGDATSAVNLAGGGLGVARQTDTVQAGPFSGLITKGSTRVKATAL